MFLDLVALAAVLASIFVKSDWQFKMGLFIIGLLIMMVEKLIEISKTITTFMHMFALHMIQQDKEILEAPIEDVNEYMDKIIKKNKANN